MPEEMTLTPDRSAVPRARPAQEAHAKGFNALDGVRGRNSWIDLFCADLIMIDQGFT